ncbi:MAG: SEC-C domain-containing protein [Clostridium sp.]|jgi:uncharacterized protein YecA (UPF0149 family)|nr:SEC-C domain-containing protein [Clostridium sp.]
MSIFAQWNELANKERTKEEHDKFWEEYLMKETKIYEYILEHHDEAVSGELAELAQKFDSDAVTFVGFIDGINTSLKESFVLEELKEDSDIKFDVDFEKLYYNMLDAKAYWLYNLPQWDDILTQDKRDEIKKDYNKSHIAVSNKVGRNEPCICGSGKKYKKCCGV